MPSPWKNYVRGTGSHDVLSDDGKDLILMGMNGNDTYHVSNLNTTVLEYEGDGTDEVRTELDWQLGAWIENLTLTGSTDATGRGNDLDNVLLGNLGANALYGYSGDDRLDGGAGDDTLDGGTGNDTMIGGDGDDTLIAGAGSDRLYGGAGTDVAVFSGLSTEYTITREGDNIVVVRGLERDVLAGIEMLGFTDTTILAAAIGAAVLAPVAGDDTATGLEDNPLTLSVLANDEGEDLQIASVTDGGKGTVTVNADGTLTYSPNANSNGTDSFTYTVADSSGQTATATVSVTVAAVNDAPAAVNDSFATSTVSASGSVLGNDTDVDGDSLSVSGWDSTSAHGGTVTMAADGTFSYTAGSGFAGTDTFSYTASDGNGGFSKGTVSVTVGESSHSPGGTDGGQTHDDSNPHEAGTVKHVEHDAVFNLVKHADATHTAVSSGSWFDPATWANGQVPGDGAKVVIADGVHVAYDGVSDARLFTVRVDGHLEFSTTSDSRMIVDTMVVDGGGRLTIGTEANPVRAGVEVDIVIANNGAIDVNWDPMLLSRGFISHGTVEMHGQEKTTHLKVAVDPMAGDTSIVLAEEPLNWQVGDTIVLAGTYYEGYHYDPDGNPYHPPQDEVLTISRIEGNKVFFDTALKFDHGSPRADLKTSVANYSRNITIATEDPDTAAVHERGHVMFMHSDNVDVRYAAFHELGRTDKSNVSLDVSAWDTITAETNVQGRYAFHFHRTGVDDLENPGVAVGNAVFGSPGWGFVHHDSNAILHNNATYNTFGAGFVAEIGNETGSWTDNIAIYAKGIPTASGGWGNPKNVAGGDGLTNFDLGRSGDGFWFQGRMVESTGNIAASVNNGFVYFHRGDGMAPFDAAVFDLPEALGQAGAVTPDKAPILHFSGNEAFAARAGLYVLKANPNQGHDVHTHLQDFTAWSVVEGADLNYTKHYVLENFDLVAKAPAPHSAPKFGVQLGSATADISIIGLKADGFASGVYLMKNSTFPGGDYSVVDAEITNTKEPFKNFDLTVDRVLTSADIVPGRFEISIDPLVYSDDVRRVVVTGTKTDSLGTIQIPSSSDNYDARYGEVLNILETNGFYQAADGKRYFVLEDYFSDRVTGEIFKVGHLVEIAANVPLQHPYTAYKNAKFAGMIDLDNAAPQTQDEAVQTQAGTSFVMNLLANDSDPDGDPIIVDGIVQPEHGRIFDNGDGTAIYRPDPDFVGTDVFKYWVTDGFGNFSQAEVTVDVL